MPFAHIFSGSGKGRHRPVSRPEKALTALRCSLAIALIALGLVWYSWLSAREQRPSDYDSELARIDHDIAAPRAPSPASPADADRAVRLAYRSYHRASLTGLPAEFAAAEDAINQALEQIGPASDLCLLKASFDYRFHRLPQAKADLALSPELSQSASGTALSADLALQSGNLEGARAGYARALAADRTWENFARVAYLENLADHVSAADKMYQEAEDLLTAKELRSYAWVEIQRGFLSFRHGRYEEAGRHYQRAGRAFSGDWQADAYRAEWLGAQGRINEAATLYESVIARAPRPELQQELADLFQFAGHLEKAKTWHEKALSGYLASAARGEVQYFHHLANFYADAREDGAAAELWARKDLALRPNFAAYDALAWALYRGGHFAEADAVLAKALAFGVQDAHLFYHAAMIRLAVGRSAEGRQFLQQAAGINPRYHDFHAHR